MRFSSLILLLLCFVGFSCQTSDIEEEIAAIPLPDSAKYLALGDSYTIGQGVSSNQTWPMHLSNQLSQGGVGVGEPLIIAQTGWTTGDLLRQLKNMSLPNDYSMVSLQIGVNNQYQGRSIEEFRREFRALLTVSKNHAQNNAKNVLVLTIPDWGATPFAASQNKTQISVQIKQFNDVIYDESGKMGIAVGNVNDLSLQASTTPTLLASDGLHYSGSMYEKWAERVLPLAKTILAD
ncbi:SGNH/GDSL hydrolase family protein [Rufibacter roseus]|uniref:SGNH/GDSL hydrolase family protein n=1 Tax=Rufibacter roseus TaxID=1567108 RepID=A0ABW2DL37_9BACT|nr:SGNH/GDSL hydrolase family protein [Rufibacter roseus]